MQFAPTMPRRSLSKIDQYAGRIHSADRDPRANLRHDWLAWHIVSARKASSPGALSGFSNDPTPRHRTSTRYEYLAAPQAVVTDHILAHADTGPAQSTGSDLHAES